MRLKVEENRTQGPGHAIITALQPGVGRDGLKMSLQRPGHEKAILGPSGWQASDAFVPIDQVEIVDDGLRIFIGPDVVQHMSRGNFQIKLTDGSGAQSRTAVLSWRNVAPYRPAKRAGPKPGDTVPIEKPSVAEAWQGVDSVAPAPPEATPPLSEAGPKEIVEPVKSAHDSEETSQVEEGESAKTGRRPMMLAGIGLLLVVLVAAVLFFIPKDDDSGSVVTGETLVAEPELPDALEDPRGYVRQYLTQSPTPQEMVEEATRLLTAGAVEASIALLSEAAQLDFGPAALELGKIYDPSIDRAAGAGDWPNASAKTAYQYYLQAKEQAAAGVDEAVVRLTDWITKAADEGDRDAEKLLRVLEMEN